MYQDEHQLTWAWQSADSSFGGLAEELANESKPESADAVRKAIEAVTDHKPSDADVARVKARLAAGGWPLAKPDRITDSAEFP